MGHEVTVCPDGSAALKALEKGSFDAAKRSDLLDLGPAENPGRHEDQHEYED